jgi:CheY-like chemotaxis protein
MDEIVQEKPKQGPTENAHHRGLRILIVDDSEAAAKILGWSLELLGHEIRAVNDGAAALRIAADLKPQVVLMDINLSNLNGYELCRIMRAESDLGKTLFIAQTGWGEAEHRRRSREAGFAYHMVKPVDMARLTALLEAHASALYPGH